MQKYIVETIKTKKVFLVRKDGMRIAFKSLEALSYWLSKKVSSKRAVNPFGCLGIGQQFVVDAGQDYFGNKITYYYEWVIEDASGNRIPPGDVPKSKKAIKRERYVRKWREKAFIFRSGPVSNTGGARGRRVSDYMRYPQTHAILKECYKPLEEFEPNIRSSRSRKYIPTSWDDIPRSCQRSWKKHRKTQWKE